MIKKKEERQQMLKEHLRPPSLLGPQPPVSVGQSWHVQVPSFSPFRPFLLSARALTDAKVAACALMHTLLHTRV
jgi:hypothetical protein